MSTTAAPPQTPTLDLPLDEANIPGNVMDVLRREDLTTFRDLETRSKGGNVWDWLIQDDNIELCDSEDLSAKLKIAMGADTSDPPPTPKDKGGKKEKSEGPVYHASRGEKPYRWTVKGRFGTVAYADGHAGVSIRCPRPKDSEPGIALACADAVACGTVLDIQLNDASPQGSLDGMEPSPIYDIAIVNGYAVSSKSVAFRLDIETDLDGYTALARLNKADVTIDCNVLKHGREDVEDESDPNQLNLNPGEHIEEDGDEA